MYGLVNRNLHSIKPNYDAFNKANSQDEGGMKGNIFIIYKLILKQRLHLVIVYNL